MISETLEKQKNLTDSLDKASRQYYRGWDTDYTDTEFDLLLKDLQKMEKENNYIFPNSPTLRVGSDLQTSFKKISHPDGYPMLTIENVYTDDELIEWFKKMYKEHGVDTFNVSLKYDGISCELFYENGYLQYGATRGNKLVGDDITDNVRTIKDIPLSVPDSPHYYIRGEILLPKSQLERINAERVANGENPFSNCRNACSGSVKQLDSRITASRGLIFRPWDVIVPYSDFKSQTSKNKLLRELGFRIESATKSFTIKINPLDFNETLEKIRNFWEIAKCCDYDCDGIVIKIDDTDIQNRIGTKDNRAIEWGIARKWNEEKMTTTTLLDVEFLVGRTGHITPVGKLEPVECDGVVISNVILNNESYIRELDLHIGDSVQIVRSGGVIPQCIGRLDSGNDNLKDIEFPKTCPCCNGELIKKGEIWICDNHYCNAQIEGRIEQLCSKDCMDIPQVGPAMISDLVKTGIVCNDVFDIYTIPMTYNATELADVLGEGYGVKSMKTFINNILASKKRTFDKILYALSIDGIGKQNAKTLASHFKTYSNFRNATVEDLMKVEGIGPNLANAIHDWFNDFDSDYSYENHLAGLGLCLTMEEETSSAQENQILAGLNIVFSGKSSHWDGDEVEEVFTSYGAKCGHSISRKTNYLVIGDSPGPSKMNKAKDLGIEIISEKDFIEKFSIPSEFIFPDDLKEYKTPVIEETSDEESLW